MMDLTRLFEFFQGKASEKEIKQIDEQLSQGGEEAFLEYQRAHFLYDGIVVCDGEKMGRKHRISASLVRWVAAAAIVVAFAVPASLYLLRDNTPVTYPSSTLVLETQSGQMASLTLPDGSKVRLNAGSRLEYPSYFDGDERHVFLSGEAYFDIKHDEAHPFVVTTFASDVRVHGTSFNVLAREDVKLFTTTLVSGSVSLTNPNDPSHEILMKPSDIVTLQDGRLVRTQEEGASSLCWIDGRVDLRCADFRSLMRRFENVYGVRIQVRGTPPSTSRLSGEVATSHGADYALQVLGIALGIKYRLEADGSYTVTCK